MAINVANLKPASLKAKEVATVDYVDIGVNTATAVANAAQITANSKVAPNEVAAAVNNNTTTINGSKITTGTILADTIGNNAITSTKIANTLVSDNYSPQNAGWLISRNGNVEFANAYIRGTIDSSIIKGATISGSNIFSANYFIATDAGAPYYTSIINDFSTSIPGPSSRPLWHDQGHYIQLPTISTYSFNYSDTNQYARFRHQWVTISSYVNINYGENTRDARWYGQQGYLNRSDGVRLCTTPYYDGGALQLFDDRSGSRTVSGWDNGVYWVLTSCKGCGSGWTITVSYSFNYNGNYLVYPNMYLVNWNGDTTYYIINSNTSWTINNAN